MSLSSALIRHKYFADILDRINFTMLRRGIKAGNLRRVVLMEYEHSAIGSTVFCSEQIVGTSKRIHSIFTPAFLNDLKAVLGLEDSVIYTRRKIENGVITGFRQLVIQINTDYLDMPPLVRIQNVDGVDTQIYMTEYGC